ncbi:hypothetical protein CRUP_004594 [Coryphaenoides rupestris]|nr:hypothetical protein CRUP_004594 [Coryphaenoides rupestris]
MCHRKCPPASSPPSPRRSDEGTPTWLQLLTRYSAHLCMLQVCRVGGASVWAEQTVSSTTRGPDASWETHWTLRSWEPPPQASPAAQRLPIGRSAHQGRLRLVPVCGHQGARSRPPIHLPVCLRFSIDRSTSSSSLVELRAGQTASLPSEGTLTIGPLRSDDSGVYTCTASNQNQLEQRQLQLRVQADLRITTAPNNIHVSQGDTALLPCVVSGDNVNIGWSRNGVPVRPDGVKVRVLADGSLALSDAQPADEGTYTCNAYTGIYSLIVFARLCSNAYYSGFCCGSCTRHARSTDRTRRRPG